MLSGCGIPKKKRAAEKSRSIEDIRLASEIATTFIQHVASAAISSEKYWQVAERCQTPSATLTMISRCLWIVSKNTDEKDIIKLITEALAVVEYATRDVDYAMPPELFVFALKQVDPTFYSRHGISIEEAATISDADFVKSICIWRLLDKTTMRSMIEPTPVDWAVTQLRETSLTKLCSDTDMTPWWFEEEFTCRACMISMELMAEKNGVSTSKLGALTFMWTMAGLIKLAKDSNRITAFERLQHMMVDSMQRSTWPKRKDRITKVGSQVGDFDIFTKLQLEFILSKGLSRKVREKK